MNSKTQTLVTCLYVLSSDIETDDGVVNAALLECADRMANLRRTLEALLPYAQMREDIKLLEKAKELIE